MLFNCRSYTTDLCGSPIDFSCARNQDQLIKGPLATSETTVDKLVDVGALQTEAIQTEAHTVLVGNRKWIKDKNFIDIPQDIENKLLAQEQLGRTAILAAIDGKLIISYILSNP